MAKIKQNKRINNLRALIRGFNIPRAARATRPARLAARQARKHLAVFLAVAFSIATLASAVLPKNQIQALKERLFRNSNDFQAHLELAQKFLANNQFMEAEQALRLAQRIPQNNPKLEELWQQKQYSDPEDIQRLIATWEKIVEEKPDYRDGWLQLTVLYYKLYQNDKAKVALKKAFDIDPNYKPTQELAKMVSER